MVDRDIPKAYEPKKYEDSIYTQWEESGFFNPDKLPPSASKRAVPFSIAMPPPNATGQLHLGHAIMLAIQDTVIRFERMRGKKALWLPGTDHASIATQNKVERLLKQQSGKTRHDLGREKFLARVEQYVVESQSTIKNQVRKMGSSCDWSRERYTLDAGLTEAVQQAFVTMYNDGLIYRGNRIVNWCPRCQSTLADDEVEYTEQKTPFYYFKYGPVVIGTARPETKFGDKTIIVHPKDKRYKDIVGKEMEVEWILGPIKANVIADPVADMELGSGAMTITPAHSFVDFDLAQKYKLPIVKIINEEGKLTSAAGEFSGMPVSQARQKVVEVLKRKGLVEKIDEDYVHNLSVCYRCGTPVEPLPSSQWFINVNKPVKKFGGKSIKQRAIAAVKDGDVRIIPERFNKVYYHWLENLRDWCISRQIWFGHSIPVWYCNDCHADPDKKANGTYWQVSLTPPKKCADCGSTNIHKDTDTLDTWFSSGLWTFSTLGWPKKTADLKTYHPTSLMETGYDILFFWVARMIIMSTYFVDEVPFRDVYLHGLVRDEHGRKMSKSLDNIIDPLDVIEKFGADATRLSLLIGISPGNDTNLSEAKIAGYRNFVNKLWNISRYILLNVTSVKIIDAAPKAKTLADEWILSRLNELIGFATDNLAEYNFSAVGEKIYEFTWSQLADWYVEIAKIEKGKDDILLYVVQQLLRLWHPFTPYVTEVIWQQLGAPSLLMIQPWPTSSGKINKKAVTDFVLVQQIIASIRNVRAESRIAPAQRIAATIIAPKDAALLKQQATIISQLARLSELSIETKGKKPAGSLSAVVGSNEIYLPISGMLDVAKEVKRLTQEAERIATFVEHLAAKLENQRFLERAPQEIVERERQKLSDHREQLEKINHQLRNLKK